MKRRDIIRIFGLGACAVAAVTMLNMGKPEVKASSIAKGSGLAGISLCMDEIYGQNENKFVDVKDSVAPIYKVVSSVLEEDNNKVVAFSDSLEAVEPLAVTAATPEQETTETEKEEISEADEDAGKSSDELDSTEAEVKSKFENIGISTAAPYVNIRTKPSTDGKITAKLYKGSKCDIIKTVGDWVKIKSGNAKGYIKAEFLARGYDAEKLVDEYGEKYAVVNTETLNVRFDPTTDSRIATLVPMGEKLSVLKTKEGWHEVLISKDDETGENITGWVSDEFVEIKIKWKNAVTIREELEEAARVAAAEEALRRQQAALSRRNTYIANNNNNNRYNRNRTGTKRRTVTVADSGNYSATGSNIANFALKFVGNPYVWGGTSLTNGADCSGFVKSVYSNFGIGLNRTSRAQASNGTAVSLNALQPGDLVFYAPTGRISHVAVYIGGGKIVHASSPRTGIMVSSVSYSTPYCARRIVN